jgi:hypothetical protein
VAPTQQLEKRDTYFICKHIKVVSDRITPAISNVLNNIKNKLKLERLHKDQQQEIEETQKDVEQLEEKAPVPEKKPVPPPPAPKKPVPQPVKPPVKPKPSKDHLDMGGNAPARSRPGVI